MRANSFRNVRLAGGVALMSPNEAACRLATVARGASGSYPQAAPGKMARGCDLAFG